MLLMDSKECRGKKSMSKRRRFTIFILVIVAACAVAGVSFYVYNANKTSVVQEERADDAPQPGEMITSDSSDLNTMADEQHQKENE